MNVECNAFAVTNSCDYLFQRSLFHKVQRGLRLSFLIVLLLGGTKTVHITLMLSILYAFHISCHFVTWAGSTWMRFNLHWGRLHLARFTPSLYLVFNLFRTWPDNLWAVHLGVNSWTVLGLRIHLQLLMLSAGLQILIIKWES